MGCTWSSNRVAHGKVNEDCSKDASPSHGKVESSGGQPILIVWDLNAVPAPMEPEILHSFVAALRKSFVQDLQRGELELVAACDLNGEGGSKAANHAARDALAEAGFPVRMPNRPGLTQIEILEKVLIDFTAANADTAATIVVIAGVTDFHTSCAAASHANLCVERVYSNIAPSRILSASNADWQCGLADWLYANDLQDWRGKVLQASVSFGSRGSIKLTSMTHSQLDQHGVASEDTMPAINESAPLVSDCIMTPRKLSDTLEAEMSSNDSKQALVAYFLSSDSSKSTASAVAPVVRMSRTLSVVPEPAPDADAPAPGAESPALPGQADDTDDAAPAEGTAAPAAEDSTHAATEEEVGEIPTVRKTAETLRPAAASKIGSSRTMLAPLGTMDAARMSLKKTTSSLDKRASSLDKRASSLDKRASSLDKMRLQELQAVEVAANAQAGSAAGSEATGSEEEADEAMDDLLGSVESSVICEEGGGVEHMLEDEIDSVPSEDHSAAANAALAGIKSDLPLRSSVHVDLTAIVDAAVTSDAGNEPAPSPSGRRVVLSAKSMRHGVRAPSLDDAEADNYVSIMDSRPASRAESDAEESDAEVEHLPAPSRPSLFAPDPIMVWKASAMRNLREADDKAMTITMLNACAPNPTPGTPYRQLVQEYLVDRVLATWIVQGESVQALV